VKEAELVLCADDDPDDRLLAQSALLEAGVRTGIQFVEDGEELLDYLRRSGKYAGLESKQPDLILLDLAMPRKNGAEALTEIKADPALQHIPVVVLTTSEAQEDVYRVYDLGANAFVTKPDSFENLVRTMRSLSHFWFDVAIVPSGRTKNE
jgi:CheY-like chemotaxis protein